MQYRQKKLMLISFICLWLAIFCIGVYKASASPMYAPGTYKAPRIQQICYDAFIGVEYNPKRENQCRSLWTSWTEEIKSQMSASQY